MPLKVAVLEDDSTLRDDILIPGLTASGFDAEGFGAAADLYRRMLAKPFDVIVLDIGLPDEDGFEVARYLRAHSKLAIVALTGMRFDEANKSAAQADAWLTKPIDMEVLTAVIANTRRRIGIGGGTGDPTVKKWRLDEYDWALYAPDGRSVELGLSERLIMEQLLAAPGEVVPREDLIVALTDSAYDFDPHRLEMLIHRLRRKVSSVLNLSLPLRTVRGKGYTMLPTSDPRAESREAAD